MTAAIAGYKTSYQDTGKAHACDPATKTPNKYDTRDTYTSRCGQKFLHGTGRLFSQIIHFDQCQRCVQILEAEANTAEADGLQTAIATLEAWENSLPHYHPEKPGARRAIEVLRTYGPRKQS